MRSCNATPDRLTDQIYAVTGTERLEQFGQGKDQLAHGSALRLLRAYSATRPVACSHGSAGDAELGEAVIEAMRARDVGNRAVDGGPKVWRA